MATMRNAAKVSGLSTAAEIMHRDSTVTAFEKRRRLSGREASMSERESMGRWVDERPEQGDSLTLYKEDGRVFLETWFSDGCHSRDEMRVTETDAGLKLEDMGGNFFGEYFMLTQAGLEFCNHRGCFYTAPARDQMLVA